MTIELVWGTNEGTTELSAFDSALAEAGLHNYNLVTLSSVIPEGETVETSGTHKQIWDVGEMVGVVMAEHESMVTGKTIAAGLGWAEAQEGGVFFEASGESPENVRALVTRGVRHAKKTRESWGWEDKIYTQVVDHTVERNGAAVVAAIYHPI